MAAMHCVIDDRETSLLGVALPAKAIRTVVRERLTLGDILLKDAASGTAQVLMERKRMDDLLASSKTGHLMEQMERMDACNLETWLIVERHPEGLADDQRHHVFSWLIETLTRPNNHVRVMQTNSVTDTWLFVQQRASMLARTTAVARLSHWQPAKRRHLSVYVKALLAIPGISWKRAEHIKAMYPTMLTLANAIKTEPSVAHARLSKLIGKAAAKQVLDGFLEEDDHLIT